MIYLDYAKPLAKGGYILNLFADNEKDIEQVSNGKSFIALNGTDYGVPSPSSTIIITSPDKTKKTFILTDGGEWTESLLGQNGAQNGNVGLPVQVINLIGEKSSDDYIYIKPYGKFGDYFDQWIFTNYDKEKVEILKDNSFKIANNMTTPEELENCIVKCFENDKGLYLHTFYDLTDNPLCDEQGILISNLQNLKNSNQWPAQTVSYVCKIVSGVIDTDSFKMDWHCVVNSDCTNTFEELAYLSFAARFPAKGLHAADSYDSLKFMYSYVKPGSEPMGILTQSLPPIIKDDRVNSMLHQVVTI